MSYRIGSNEGNTGIIFFLITGAISSILTFSYIYLSSEIYRAQAATDAIKEKFPELYLYDPTPIPEALWRVCKGCTAVEKRGDRWVWKNDGLEEQLEI